MQEGFVRQIALFFSPDDDQHGGFPPIRRNTMTALPKLNELTVSEKIQMMESLWESLCQQPTDIPSPAWHGEILTQRENALSQGVDHFSDWDTAKASLRKSIR